LVPVASRSKKARGRFKFSFIISIENRSGGKGHKKNLHWKFLISL